MHDNLLLKRPRLTSCERGVCSVSARVRGDFTRLDAQIVSPILVPKVGNSFCTIDPRIPDDNVQRSVQHAAAQATGFSHSRVGVNSDAAHSARSASSRDPACASRTRDRRSISGRYRRQCHAGHADLPRGADVGSVRLPCDGQLLLALHAPLPARGLVNVGQAAEAVHAHGADVVPADGQVRVQQGVEGEGLAALGVADPAQQTGQGTECKTQESSCVKSTTRTGGARQQRLACIGHR